MFSKQQTLNILILQKHKLILLGMVAGSPSVEERGGCAITSILLGWLRGHPYSVELVAQQATLAYWVSLLRSVRHIYTIISNGLIKIKIEDP